MYDEVTLADLNVHDYFGMIGNKCQECDEQFTVQSKIFNQQESNVFICAKCHSELPYT